MVKLEALLTVCFAYGQHGHVKGLCPSTRVELKESNNKVDETVHRMKKGDEVMMEKAYGLLMIVEKKSRSNEQDTNGKKL
ncbi:hypothetical protein Godav_019848 [Gossypium davidsonii]|uniref:Uncharacterized protein n=1 Tax=Gossypium davidsonii TaxID=34287 RepID=A0A7J8R158_GOSDV|nr:hypothetical protein [Gossypium davidsonii]